MLRLYIVLYILYVVYCNVRNEQTTHIHGMDKHKMFGRGPITPRKTCDNHNGILCNNMYGQS